MGCHRLPSESTAVLVQQAKEGDHQALEALLARYYGTWLKKYHGSLSSTLRRLYDTEDLVQSAVTEAISNLPQLKNDAAFYTWVTAIIRHQIAKKHRKLKKEASLDEPSALPGGREEGSEQEKVSAAETYLTTLGAILELFPHYPEPMAAAVLKHLDGCSIDEIAARFQRPRTTVHRWVQTGTDLLRARLADR